jgi:transcriptional regulator with XRE-family HTH domain
MRRKRIPFSDQLRQAIDGCGKSRYEISQETGIDQATLSRFMNDKGGLSMPVLDLLTDYLGLNITTASKPRKRKGR